MTKYFGWTMPLPRQHKYQCSNVNGSRLIRIRVSFTFLRLKSPSGLKIKSVYSSEILITTYKNTQHYSSEVHTIDSTVKQLNVIVVVIVAVTP
jgi:hypothetical protein